MIGRVKRLLLLVLLVCLAAGCGSSKACPHGAELVLRAVPQRGEQLTPQGMELARNIISSRFNAIGPVSATATVSTRGSDEIVIDFAGTHVPKNVTQIASVTGNLQFFDFEKDLAAPTVQDGNPTPYPSLYSLLTAVKNQASNGTPEAYYLLDGSVRHAVLQGPAATKGALLVSYSGKQPARTTILAVPANREVVSGTRENFTASTRPVKTSPDGNYYYLFKLPPEISGSDIHESTVTAGADPNTGVPEVTLGFTSHGAKEFQAITKAEYDRGTTVAGLHGSAGQLDQRYVQHNAIVLDGRLQATPYIDYTDPVLSLGIASNEAVIANLGSSEAAKRVALVIQSGSLPYRFEVVSGTSGCHR